MNVYTGLVIDTNNPKYPGKVQVYIFGQDPIIQGKKSVSRVLYAGNDDKNGDLKNNVLEQLRKSCSWASVMQPVFGGSNNVRTDTKTGKTTTSKSATTVSDFEYKDLNNGAKPYSHKFNKYGARFDAFADPSLTYTQNCNIAGFDYFPESYPNSPNGTFSLPEVNSYVYVAMIGKGTSIPIILGAAPRRREIDEMLLFE